MKTKNKDRNIMFAMIIVSAIFLIICLTACKKAGCTDSTATNYCSDCKNDNSCTYQSKILFWYGKQTADSLLINGSTALTFYFDNVIIGSSAASVYFLSVPSCQQSGTVSFTKNLGSVKNKDYSYKVIDQTNKTLWEGSITLDASNDCIREELQW